MIVDLKQLYGTVGERLSLDYTADAEKLGNYSFLKPLTVKGSIVNRAGIVILTYNANFTLNAVCDRCLREFAWDGDFDFEYVLVRSLNGEDDGEYIVTEADKLDMDELAIADCLLELPSKMLCKEDCKGLCRHCGADLNINDCGCQG